MCIDIVNAQIYTAYMQHKEARMKDLFELMDLPKIDLPTPAYKLVRNDDPSTSHAAAEQPNVTAMERIVLHAIDQFPNGCISDDVLAAIPQYRYSTVTARYKQLKEKGLVIVDDTKRKGESGRQQLVMWSKQNYNV